jgi:uncharacterized protein YjiS (DUF1127 family)
MKAVSLATPTGRSGHIVLPRTRRRALRAGMNRIYATLREWRRRSRDRAELARFDERMLRDIGVTPGDVLQEINKPFWRR